MRLKIKCSECKKVMTVIAGKEMKLVHPNPGKHYCQLCDDKRQIAVDIAMQAREQAEEIFSDKHDVPDVLKGIFQK